MGAIADQYTEDDYWDRDDVLAAIRALEDSEARRVVQVFDLEAKVRELEMEMPQYDWEQYGLARGWGSPHEGCPQGGHHPRCVDYDMSIQELLGLDG